MPKVPLGRRVLLELPGQPGLPDHLVPLGQPAQSGPQDQKAIQVPRQNPNSKTLGTGPFPNVAPFQNRGWSLLGLRGQYRSARGSNCVHAKSVRCRRYVICRTEKLRRFAGRSGNVHHMHRPLCALSLRSIRGYLQPEGVIVLPGGHAGFAAGLEGAADDGLIVAAAGAGGFGFAGGGGGGLMAVAVAGGFGGAA